MDKTNDVLEEKVWDPMLGNVPIRSLEDFKKYTDPFFSNVMLIVREMETMDN